MSRFKWACPTCGAATHSKEALVRTSEKSCSCDSALWVASDMPRCVAKLQEEIAALRAKVSEQEWEYASVVNQFHDAIKHNTALEKVAVRLYNLGYHSGHEDTVEGCYTHIYEADMDEYHDDIVADILREAGYLKEDGDE